MNVAAIIAGGGKGIRLGASIPKQFLLLGGRPIISWSIQAFMDTPTIKELVVVVPDTEFETVEKILKGMECTKPVKMAPGGGTRQESVKNGLDMVSEDMEWVAVHDAARPLITSELIEGVCLLAQDVGAAILASPSIDTVKEVDENRIVIKTLARSRIFLAQTPQVARREDIIRAYSILEEQAFEFTDEASLLEKISIPVGIYPGGRRNIKITEKEDLMIAEAIIKMDRERS